ncbi:MAG: zinc ribbon domain-containing protein [Promethearchaeota archaeon]
MIEGKLIWEENHLKHKITCCLICGFIITILYILSYVIPRLIEGDLSILILLFILVPVLIFSYWLIVVSTEAQGQFHIIFFKNRFIIRTLIRKKTIYFSDLIEFEIILGKRKEWSIKPKRRPRRYFSQVITTFKLTYALSQKVKKYTIHARFNASSRYLGKEAEGAALQKRLDFEKKIRDLSISFPKLITINDQMDTKIPLKLNNSEIRLEKYGSTKICPNCGEQNNLKNYFCQNCGYKFKNKEN